MTQYSSRALDSSLLLSMSTASLVPRLSKHGRERQGGEKWGVQQEARSKEAHSHHTHTHTCMSCGVGVTESQPSVGNFEKNKEILLLLEVCTEWGKNKLFYVIYMQVSNAYLRQIIFDSRTLQIPNVL